MSGKQKIVVLIDWYLPGTKAGGPVRSVYSLVHLLKNEFDFYILTSNKDLGSDKEYDGISANTVFADNGINYCYFNQERLNEKNLFSVINKIDPALIYINSFWSYSFSISIVRAKKAGRIKAPLLLAPRGMLSAGALGLKAFKKRTFLVLSKIFKWHSKICFHATNVQEKQEILSLFPDAIVKTAPNLNTIKPFFVSKQKQKGELKLFYLSRIAKVKNLHFALELLAGLPPGIQVTYDIYGNIEDQDYWSQCKKMISQLPVNIRVNYVRELRFDEIQRVILPYHALLLPTLNENFGHSIVESMASGCVPVISDQTPWKDLNTHDAGYALSLNNKTAFADALVQLAEFNEAGFEIKSKNAITYISTKLDLDRSKQQYISLFNESIKN